MHGSFYWEQRLGWGDIRHLDPFLGMCRTLRVNLRISTGICTRKAV